MPFIIGVAGSSGSGKTTISAQLAQHYGKRCVVISADNYYLRKEDKKVKSFDVPDAIDFPLLRQHISQLIEGNPIDMPVYDFETSDRTEQTIRVEPCDIIILEGILVLHDEELQKLFGARIFVKTDLDTCRDRRIKRDIEERGHEPEQALEQWNNEVLPSYNDYVNPSRKNADIIIKNTDPYDNRKFDISPVIADLENIRNPKSVQTTAQAITGRRKYSMFPAQKPTPVANDPSATLVQGYS